MPYITNERRVNLDNNGLDTLIGRIKAGDMTPGDLNYIFTVVAHAYIGDTSYQKINDVLGALEGAKLELYRRKAVPYEDKKEKENGPI